MENERISKEQSQIDVIKQSMEDFKKNFADMKESNNDSHDRIINKIDSSNKEIKDFIEKSLKQKADKWVQDAVKWFICIVMGIVVSALIYSIIIK